MCMKSTEKTRVLFITAGANVANRRHSLIERGNVLGSYRKFDMPKEPVIISLKESLRSLQISFLQFGTPLLQIAERLGPPKGWITNRYDQPVPLYWLYPGGLELTFEPEPPYQLTAFKLSPVGRHKGRTTNFSYYVRMRNDFPMIDTSVSDFLRSGLWDLEKVRVGICTDLAPLK